ncbi:hypothetical protein NC651_019760 [Populus alba x Populus x berolinensis]|nr:hypothetical protein NC651_019760 [Populus alba x Populus x berolinensis]
MPLEVFKKELVRGKGPWQRSRIGQGPQPGRHHVEKLTAEALDSDLDRYHLEAMKLKNRNFDTSTSLHRIMLESRYPSASVVQNTCKASSYIVMETRCMIIKSVVPMRFEGKPISSPEIHRVILPQGRGARGRYILPLIISLQEEFLPCRGPTNMRFFQLH